MKPDRLYAEEHSSVSRFQFDESVVEVFSDMIRRSVPGYGELLALLPLLGERYVTENSHCYDLGCSLGASTVALLSGISHKNYRMVAIDSSQAMIEKAQQLARSQSVMSEIEWLCSDINDVPLNNASVIMMNFTLQFIDPEMRQALLKKLYDALNPGGILLLSEKIQHDDDFITNELDQLHLSFKRANGYSDLEIAQKRQALDNVLRADSYEQHCDNLTMAGFAKVHSWYQNLNFTSIIAWKQ